MSTLNVAKRMNGQKEEMEFRRKHMQRWPLKRLKVFKEWIRQNDMRIARTPYQNAPSFLRRQRWAAPLPPLCVMQRTHCCVRAPPPSLFPYIRNLRREEKRKEFFPVSYIAGSGKRERRVSRILFFWEEALKSNFGLGSRGKQGDELMRILWGLERWKIKKGKKRKKSGQKYLLREEESFFLLWETAKSANCEKIAKSKPPL